MLTLLSCCSSWAAEPPGVHTHMTKHLLAATAARDAVIAGDFDTARSQLNWLAGHDAVDLPAAAAPHIKKLREAARIGDSESPRELALSVARVAGACGECHVATTGPKFGPMPLPDGDEEHMARHRWSADRMWEGLLSGEKGNWTAGALMLLEGPRKQGEHKRSPDIDALAKRVHQAGPEGLNALSSADRIALYGDFLATCAECHTATGGGPSR